VEAGNAELMGLTEAARTRRTFSLSSIKSADLTAWIDTGQILLVTRLGFFALAYAATWLFSVDSLGPPSVGFFDMWTRWDAQHFISVAERGYAATGWETSQAYFPLLPLTIRAFTYIGIQPVLAGLIISGLSSWVACVFLYKLAERDVGPGTGTRAALYLLLFPTAVFLIAPYSEALYLAGAVGAFYLARDGRWLTAGIPAAVAVGARAAGLFLLAGLVAEFFRQRDFSLDRILNTLTGILIGLLPLLGYSLFLVRLKGDPFFFLTAQSIGWGRSFVGPVASFLNTWRTLAGGYNTNWLFAWRLEVAAAIIGAAIVLWAAIKREWGYATYMGTGLAVLTTSSWYYSIPRLLLTWFPIALFLAAFTKSGQKRHDLVLVLFASAAAMGVILYTKSFWFF
jgi:hypothetical protein